MNKKGVLLVNLGSPDSTSIRDVKKYLGEFLMDERVIDMPYLKRLILVKGIILNVRPKKTSAAYQKIWWKEGSPLIVLSERFFEKLKKKVDFSLLPFTQVPHGASSSYSLVTYFFIKALGRP